MAFTITFPHAGDILNRHDGNETDEGLRIHVTGTTVAGKPILVNGTPATVEGTSFSCDVLLDRRCTEIRVESGGSSQTIQVLYNRGSRKRYRYSVDDNIEVFKDLAADPDRYPSLFDHWYLKFWREMHEQFGAKIHLNVYYQTDGFDLSEMPDRWRDEWRANAHWLHLSFHALQNTPDRPYRNARYAQIAHDYDLVCGHIRRFAGNEVISATTTIHWAECPKDGVRALRDRGIENLIGIFEGHLGAYTTGYYLLPEMCRYIDSRGAWHDRDTGMTFVNCAAVVNALDLEAVPARLDQRAASPHESELIELLIHEQYFRKELDLYQPDVMDKVRVSLEWLAERGYEPVFWSDGFLGTPK